MKGRILRINLLTGFLSGIALASHGQAEKDAVHSKNIPVIFINGKPVLDTVRLSEFERIDYIKGRQAIELVGPRGQGGVYLVSGDGKIPFYGIVTSPNGNKIKGVKIISNEGKLLATTNECGTFFISTVKLYDVLRIQKKGFKELIMTAQQTDNKLSLVRKRKK